MRRAFHMSPGRWAALGTAALGVALVVVVLLLVNVGTRPPSAPSCGSPRSAHSQPIDTDPAVQCFREAAATCREKELVVNGLHNDNSVDEHFVVTPDDHCRIDDYVTHYLNGLPNTSLDYRCTAFAELPDWGLVLTGCTPAVQCYEFLGAPVVDPPASVTPAPGPTPLPAPAGPGAPAVSGQPHC